jgi:hypothetical protein
MVQISKYKNPNGFLAPPFLKVEKVEKELKNKNLYIEII